MKTSVGKIVLVTVLLPLAATPQASAPGKVGPRTTPTPTPIQAIAPAANQPKSVPGSSNSTAAQGVSASSPPQTPASPKLNPGVAPAPISGPQYSPTQLDFGSLWEGESAKRTITLTPPMDGWVTVSFPGGGGFWVAESRVYGHPSGSNIYGPPSGSKNDPKRQNGPISQWQVKSRAKFPVAKSIAGIFPQIVTAGDQIQVDIVFQPVSESKELPIYSLAVSPGTQSIEITIVGPGSTKFWWVKIPARGVFNGPKTQ